MESKGSLGARHRVCRIRIELQRHSKGAPERLEHGLALMVRIIAAQVIHVQRELRVIDESLEKLPDQIDVEAPNHGSRESDLPDQPGAPGKIDHDAAQRFVQGNVSVAETSNAALVAGRLTHRLSERNADTLDGGVTVDVQIPARLDGQTERAVTRQLFEHVIEEPDAGFDMRRTRLVQIDGDPDPGFLGFPDDLGAARRHFSIPRGHSKPPTACTKASFSCGVPTVTRRQPASSGWDSDTHLTRIPRRRKPANSRSASATRNSTKLAAESKAVTPRWARNACNNRWRSDRITAACASRTGRCASRKSAVAKVNTPTL